MRNNLGTHVRRVNGKELSDDEMIEHYLKLVKKYGEKLKAKWVYGMAIISDKGEKDFTWSKDSFYLVDIPSEVKNPGYPLNSISFTFAYNKYFSEFTEEDKKKFASEDRTDDVISFIKESLNNLCT